MTQKNTPAESGRFYLKRTSHGNLIGECSSNIGTKLYTESADLEGANTDEFEGHYLSTWQFEGKAHIAKLTISPLPGPAKLFKLEWRGKLSFVGEAMLCDDILVGDYHSVP